MPHVINARRSIPLLVLIVLPVGTMADHRGGAFLARTLGATLINGIVTQLYAVPFGYPVSSFVHPRLVKTLWSGALSSRLLLLGLSERPVAFQISGALIL